MFKGKTSSGFEYDTSENIGNDYRFVKALAKMNSKTDDQFNGMVEVVDLVLGDRESDLMEFVKEEDGTIPTDKVLAIVKEIVEEIGKSKLKN